MQYFKEVIGYKDSLRVVVIVGLAIVVLVIGFVDAYALSHEHAEPGASRLDGHHSR